MRLNDVTVVDFTHLLPGPYATQLLADVGAEIWKVEPPDGDAARKLNVGGTGEGTLFPLVNRGKKSLQVDLKADGADQLLERLFAEADVVLEQFKPGVAERLNIDYETVSGYAPDIVYCSLSGYGQKGPFRDHAGHDINYLGHAGVLDMNRNSPDDRPVIPGVPIADMAGGLFATTCIVMSLLSREFGTESGEYIDVSMTDVSLSFAQVLAAGALFGNDPRPGETLLSGRAPCYSIYRAADGEYLTVGAIEPHFWEALCVGLDRPELVEKHLSSDPNVRQAVREELEAAFDERDAATWLDHFDHSQVPIGRVNQFKEAMSDPQVLQRETIRNDLTPPRMGFPAASTGAIPEPQEPPPELGEHTTEVVTQLGFDESECRKFQKAGIIER